MRSALGVSLAVGLALASCVGCGAKTATMTGPTTASSLVPVDYGDQRTVWAPSARHRFVMPTMTSDLSVIRAYLGAVMAGDCKDAQRLMLPSARTSADLCGSANRMGIRVDAWHLGPRDGWASGTVVEGAPIDLHFVLGPNGRGPARWISWTLGLRQVGNDYYVESGWTLRTSG